MIVVAVRTLIEFAARSGSLCHRYTPSPTAQEGIEGHAQVTGRRGASYQAEYAVAGNCEGLQLAGRADGYDPDRRLVEEIKTHRGEVSRLSDEQQALHWAQLRAYGALICQRDGLDQIRLRLTYFELANGQEHHQEETASAEALWRHLERYCICYRAWAEQERAHREARDRGLEQLRFPFPAFRDGQRAISESVYRSVVGQRALIIQAPTGIGKTLGTLFPGLMAMPRVGLDRLFYLTARNTGRSMALETLQRIMTAQTHQFPLRVMVLHAREEACEYPDRACNGDSCPLAEGFFDRLAAARQAAVDHCSPLEYSSLRRIALAKQICPYYLGQELARWFDLVIADVNRFFDRHALLRALTRQNSWQVALLIDEGHNLIGRARGMYSGQLDQAQLLRVKRSAPGRLRKPLQRLARQWSNLIANGATDNAGKVRLPRQLEQPPKELSLSLQGVISSIVDYLSEQPADRALQELLFSCLAFAELAEGFADHSLCEITREGRGRAQLKISNMIPAPFLTPSFELAQSCVIFSATLNPPGYHQDLLGLPDSTVHQVVESPFAADQLQIKLVTGISTRLQHRASSVEPIVQLICQHYRDRPGNHLVYLSSFSYLQLIYDYMRESAPDIPIWRQQPAMRNDERQGFIDRFEEGGAGIGFAVLGGAFAEGIDLPGRRLIGVFIATLGLPPFDSWHETLRVRLQARFGLGYEYTYLYPGMQKVVQAAGRLIRTESDQGEVVLIDDRFARPEVRQLFPSWWPEPIKLVTGAH